MATSKKCDIFSLVNIFSYKQNTYNTTKNKHKSSILNESQRLPLFYLSPSLLHKTTINVNFKREVTNKFYNLLPKV